MERKIISMEKIKTKTTTGETPGPVLSSPLRWRNVPHMTAPYGCRDSRIQEQLQPNTNGNFPKALRAPIEINGYIDKIVKYIDSYP
ncbi:hypothetical protein OUZ56_013113 [Daphnia magna]|uniref:Uncharacterized protein n=1 Tax=Daphnia magna TaxID=35525 RepID=A0ABQ9Z4X0_9CRUS|nr:hypothetical protein OUZ56_013113 [Daphnia magna]